VATTAATQVPPLASGPEGHTQRLLTVVKAGSIQDVKAKPTDKVHTWPHLLVGEFVASLAVTAFLLVFSAFVNAPLLTLANFNLTPNPSKAPWYFLGLQEMLVYFDPWIAGVVMPGLLVVGLMFKASVAPFHAWTPDVYQGAPTPVTAFMAACTKVAAFGAILRLLYVAFGTSEWTWRPLVYGIAIVSMVVGAVLGLTQTDLKRMLAYSSIAHAGFLLTGVLGYGSGADGTGTGLGATMFYLLAYGLTTIGVFAVLTLVRDGDGEATHLSKWAGLGRRSPLTAAVMALFLLALAGIPLTSGFTGKFAVFRAAIDDGAWPLVVVALLASAVAAFFYLRVIVLMYFSEPAADGPTVGVPGLPTTLVLAVTVTATVGLGVIPGAVLDLAEQAAIFVG